MKNICSLTLLASLLFSTTGFPNHLGPFTKITAPGGTTEDHFGSRLALSADGKLMLLGAPGTLKLEDWGYMTPGAAYFFAKDKAGVWSLQHRVDGGPGGEWLGDGTGDTVALSGDGKTALIGSPYAGGCGGIYGSWVEALVRKRGAWTNIRGLGFVDCNSRRESIALSPSGQVALLGRPYDGEYATGEVYVFVRKGDGFHAQPATTIDIEDGLEYGTPILSSGGEPGFGRVLALSRNGSRMIIGGNPGEPVYVFGRKGAKWKEIQRLDVVGADQIALSDSGAWLVVGAPSTLQAHVYVWDKTGYIAQSTLVGPSLNQFGTSVAVSPSGFGILVGAPAGSDPSAAYVFQRFKGNDGNASWEMIEVISPPEPQPWFGAAVAIGGRAVKLIGSPVTPLGEPQSCATGVPCGAVYVR